MSNFKATHILTIRGISCPVHLSNGALLTKKQIELHLPAEFCMFNGKVCLNTIFGARVERDAKLVPIEEHVDKNVIGV